MKKIISLILAVLLVCGTAAAAAADTSAGEFDYAAVIKGAKADVDKIYGAGACTAENLSGLKSSYMLYYRGNYMGCALSFNHMNPDGRAVEQGTRNHLTLVLMIDYNEATFPTYMAFWTNWSAAVMHSVIPAKSMADCGSFIQKGLDASANLPDNTYKTTVGDYLITISFSYVTGNMYTAGFQMQFKEGGSSGSGSGVIPTAYRISIPSGQVNSSLEYQSEVQNHCYYCARGGYLYGAGTASHGAPSLTRWDFPGLDSQRELIAFRNRYVVLMPYCDGSYIYYLQDGVCRISTSGRGNTQLLSERCYFQVTDKYIYYTDSDDRLCRMSKDGYGQTVILNKPVFCWFVFGDGILYQDDRDGETLHVCDLSGKNDVKLNSLHSWNPIFDGEFIYYAGSSTSDSTYASLYRMRPDGSENTRLCSQTPGNIAVYGNYVFFINYDDSDRIYRINKDGKNLVCVVDSPDCNHIQIIGGRLAYAIVRDNIVGGCYVCDLNGYNTEQIH